MKLKHWLVFILLGAIWSSSFMWIKIAVKETGPVTLVAFRVLFGLLFGIAVIIIQRTRLPKDFKSWSPLFLLGITNIALPFFLISWGEQTIDSAVAAILDATVPLFTIVIAHYSLKDDKISIQKLLGLLTGFAGVALLLSKDIDSPAGSILGQAAVILASVLYAWSGVYVRKRTVDTPGILRSAGPLVSATAVMWLAVLTTERPVVLPHLSITWIALLFLGIIGSGFAFFLAFYLIHEIGPSRTSMVTYIFPLGGVILGAAFLHEDITWQVFAGGALIIISLAVTNKKPVEKPAGRN